MKNKIKKLNQSNVLRFKLGNFFLTLSGILMIWHLLNHFIIKGQGIDTYHGYIFAEISFLIGMIFFFLIIYDIIHLMCLDIKIEYVDIIGIAAPGSDLEKYTEHLRKMSEVNKEDFSTEEHKKENKNT